MPLYRRTLAYFRPFLPQTLFATALTLLSIGFNLLKPWPFKYIVDGILAPSDAAHAEAHAVVARWLGPVTPPTAVLLLCGLIVLFHLLGGVINMVTNIIFVRVGLQALLKMRTELYAYLQSLPLKFHDARRAADSSFRVAYDSQSIQTIYNKGFSNIFQSVITLVGTFAVMVTLDLQLTLISLAIIPFIIAAIRFYALRIRSESTTIQERESAVLTVAQEGLASVRMVHAFGQQEREVRQFHSSARESLEANLRLTGTSMKSALAIGTLMAFGTAAMYWIGSLHVLHGTLQLGTLLVFASYLTMLYQPLEALTYTAWALEGAAAGIQRCFEVLDREDDVKDAPNAVQITSTQGAIALENVAFGYDNQRLILKNVSVDIAPGETVAFVGGTGEGKSTLLSLVPRFYDPNAGRVLLDGRDLKAISKQSLRHQIGIVLQDTLLFSTTIRENIAYSRPDATEEEVIEAAKRAQAHDFIMAMPGGYRAQVGERGGHLSVGQRQRIGIARAFLKNAPILLLDEPTSALDPSTEAAIMETIKELMRGRTTLIISHRIATIHEMDKIVVLKHGCIAEIGKGPELVTRGGVYAALYRAANLGHA
jgi:ATP-binding cassette subfamily B protein/subfamily B ATP-binding cassette protein MsbA